MKKKETTTLKSDCMTDFHLAMIEMATKTRNVSVKDRERERKSYKKHRI